jgi:hypothetical protein
VSVSVKDGLAELLIGEVVDFDPLGNPGGVLPAAVLESSHELLLLGIDRDHRLALLCMLGDLAAW